ncbi:restriction endonuclease subunit S [Streptomyces sp. NBC_00237]|uniref:restriction endonuclease subunit S n=1 Tax=Streptomyces sp. NBC_00237 TaxID=2975687 RepID=UPI0022523069|nr:restriction endonuclease subunit S [Streptomyces sp. NBC_00237]MCX5204210.1 restriction endonuclease subunit S [Streptomyces sp. NBC_00237]
MVRLKNLCVDAGQYGIGVSAETYADSGTRLLRTTDISSGTLTSSAQGVFIAEPPEEKFTLKEGDLLLSRSGTPPGQSYLVRAIDSGATFAGYLVRFRPAFDTEPRFLGYVARSAPFQHTIHSESVASTIQNFNAERYANIQLQAPAVEEQRRIADFLDAETARIDRLSFLQAQVMLRLDEREQAQLDLAIDEITGNYGAVPLRRYLLGVQQGSSPQCDNVPAKLDEWGVLKVSALRPGRFAPEENKRLPDDVSPDRTNVVREGDLLITRANTPQLVGSTAVVREVRGKLLLSDKIFRVRLDGRVLPKFVELVARGRRTRNLCAVVSNGASQSMANIRFEEVKQWPLPDANLAQQQALVARVSTQGDILEVMRGKVNRQLDLLTERRQALITAAVTGQFDVTTASGRNVTDGVH